MKTQFRNRLVATPSSKSKWSLKYIPITSRGRMIALYVHMSVFIIYWDKPLTIKQRLYQIRNWYRRQRTTITHHYRMVFDKKPIYWSLFSRDCDMCESTSFGKSKNYREHEDWLNDPDEWDWVEGATSVDIISRDEWLHHVGEPVRVRDRIMEAYENGRGNSIYV